MSSPKRFSNGVTNAANGTTLGSFVNTDPTKTYQYFDDFLPYVAANYLKTATSVGAGTSAAAFSDVTGGGIVITTAANEDDALWCQMSGDGGTTMNEVFYFATGKKAWFKCQFQGSEATQQDFMLGLWKDQADPIDTAPTDGVWFNKADGSTDINFHVVKNSSYSSESGIATLAANTDVVLGFYWDGVDTFTVYVNDAEVATVSSGTLPDDELLCLSFGTQNGAAAAKTMTVKYIFAAMER